MANTIKTSALDALIAKQPSVSTQQQSAGATANSQSAKTSNLDRLISGQPSREEQIYSALLSGVQSSVPKIPSTGTDKSGARTNDERDKLLEQLKAVHKRHAQSGFESEFSGFAEQVKAASSGESSRTLDHNERLSQEAAPIIARLRALDQQLGNDPQDYEHYAYTVGERATDILTSSVESSAGGIAKGLSYSDYTGPIGVPGQFDAIVDVNKPKEERERIREEREKRIDEAFGAMGEWGEEHIDRSNQTLENAKYDLGTFGRGVVDVSRGLVDVGIDTALTAAAGGVPVGMLRMGASAFGNAAYEAQQKGADREHQIIAGFKAAAIEVATEKIGGPFEKAYGKTILGKAANEAFEKFAKSSAFKKFILKSGYNFLSEGGEEVLSSLLNTAFDNALAKYESGFGDIQRELRILEMRRDIWVSEGKSTTELDKQIAELTSQRDAIKEQLEKYDWSEIMYEGLIGGLTGLVGGTAEAINTSGVEAATDRANAEAEARAKAVEEGRATNSVGLVKEMPSDPTSSEQFVLTRLMSLNEDTAREIVSKSLNPERRNAYEQALEDLTGITLTGSEDEKVKQILSAAQKAAGASESAGSEIVPPTPVEAPVEAPDALNSDLRETEQPATAESRQDQAIDALLGAQQKSKPKRPRSARDIALQQYGYDMQAEQEMLENNGVDVDASDFDEDAATSSQPLTGQDTLLQEAGIAPQTALPNSAQHSNTESGEFYSAGPDNEGRQQNAETATVVSKLRENLESLRDREPVIAINGSEIPQGGRASERMLRFIARFGGKVNRPGFGDVLFSRSKIVGSVIHGASEAKIQSFAAVPSIIQNGIEIDHQTNWKGKSYDSYIFAAPINYRGETRFVGVVVNKDRQSNRYYVHEVIAEDGSLIYKTEAPSLASDGPATQESALDTIPNNGASELIIAQQAEESNINPTAISEEDAFLNSVDEEKDELERRDRQREENRYQEQRWEDKHAISSSGAYAQQQREQARAERNDQTPKYNPDRDMGTEGYEELKRTNSYLQKAVSTEGKTGDGKPDVTKRVFSDKTFGAAKDSVEAFEKFVNGAISFAEFTEAYDKMEGNPFYEKEVAEAIKAAKDAIERDHSTRIKNIEGQVVDLAEANSGQLSKATVDAINYAASKFAHRLNRVGQEGINGRATMNAAVKEAAQKGKGRAKSVAGVLEKFKGMQLRPDIMFEHLGSFVKSSPLYKLAEDHKQAIKDKQNAQRTALEYFAAATKMKGYQDFATGKAKIKSPIPGHSDSEMSLNVALCLLKTLETKGAIEHIARYGAQFAANEGELYSGKRNSGFGDKTTYGQTLSLLSEKAQALMDQAKSGKEIAHARAKAEIELKALADSLKAEVMKNDVAKALYSASSKCMKYLARNMNHTSQLLWGEDFATEGATYFPMEWVSDAQNYSLLNDPRNGLKGMGIVQQREGDTQPLRIRTFTDVMGRYIDQSTDWSAFSDLSDRLELMSRNNPGREASLTATIGEQYGRFYADWLDNYVKDLNGTRDSASKFMSQLRSNLASAALTLNGGVALKQSPSYWDAAGVIDMSILAKRAPGLFKSYKSFERNALIQEVSQRTGMLGVRKNGGNIVSEATENARSLSGKVNKFMPSWMTNWITRTDVRTTSNLMLACADQVLKDNPSLKQGSEAYYQAVAAKFEEVILKSQPVYTRQARADYMRTNNEVVRTLAMFRTQQTQNFNQLVEAIGEYQNANGETKAEAAKHLRQVLAGQVTANVMFGILSAVARAGLHKWDDFEDEEGNFNLGKTAKRVSLNTLGAVASTMWLGNHLEAILVDTASRGKTSEFYGVEDNAISLVSDIGTAVIGFAKKPNLKTGSTLVFNLSQATGIPLKNAYGMVNSIAMFALDADRAKTGGPVWDDGKSSDLIKMIQSYYDQDEKKRATATFDAAVRSLKKGDGERFDVLLSTLDPSDEKVVAAVKASAKEYFVSEEITREQYRRILEMYAGMSREDAKATVESQAEKAEYDKFLASDSKIEQLDAEIADAKSRANEYDTKPDLAAMDKIIGAMLESDADTDRLVKAKTSVPFQTVYDALRGAGQSPKQAYTTFKSVDSDSNGSLKQAEIYAYYANNPGMEYVLQQIWAAKGWKTSWSDYKAKQK